MFVTNPASAANVKTYTVNFDNTKTQNKTLDIIENELSSKSAEDLDLKILFFSNGKALRINASAVPGVKIQYENTSDEVKKKISHLQQQGVSFIVCDNNPKKKQIRVTSNAASYNNGRSTKVQTELDRMQSQGYNCIKP